MVLSTVFVVSPEISCLIVVLIDHSDAVIVV